MRFVWPPFTTSAFPIEMPFVAHAHVFQFSDFQQNPFASRIMKRLSFFKDNDLVIANCITQPNSVLNVFWTTSLAELTDEFVNQLNFKASEGHPQMYAKQYNAALERLAHATRNKGPLMACPLQARVRCVQKIT